MYSILWKHEYSVTTPKGLNEVIILSRLNYFEPVCTKPGEGYGTQMTSMTDWWAYVQLCFAVMHESPWRLCIWSFRIPPISLSLTWLIKSERGPACLFCACRLPLWQLYCRPRRGRVWWCWAASVLWLLTEAVRAQIYHGLYILPEQTAACYLYRRLW